MNKWAGFTFFLASLLMINDSTAQQQPGCELEKQCEDFYMPQVQDVNRRLREAMNNLKKVVDQQRELLKLIQNCSNGDSSGKEVVLKGSLNPCSAADSSTSDVLGITQVEKRIYFTCEYYTYMPVYNSETLQFIDNFNLPGPNVSYSQKKIRNLFSDPKTLDIYVVLQYATPTDPTIREYVWRANVNLRQWVTVVLQQPDTYRRMGRGIEYPTMYANTESIYFRDASGASVKYLRYSLPSTFNQGQTRTLIQTSTLGFYFGGFNYVAEVNSEGQFVRYLGMGLVQPKGANIGSYINDMVEGPPNKLLLPVANDQMLVILDTKEDSLRELISSPDIQSPHRVSYNDGYKSLVVAEFNKRGDGTCVRVFKLNTPE